MMARGQKKAKKELTPEERLQHALVPKEEWPYELPEGWKWVTLGKLTDVIGGGTPSTRHSEYYEGGTIPWLSPADLSGYSDIFISRGHKNITQEGLNNSSARLLPKGTVCLSSRAPIGYVVIAKNSLCTNQGFKSFTPSEYIYPEFLYWYLKANKSMLESMASGTTFLELSGKKAGQIVMPLPPIEVQKSISAFIDREFARLDEAKDQIQSVLDSSEDRKQSILHKAFAGELTEKWRKKNSKEKKWTFKCLDEVCSSIFDGDHMSPPKADSGIPFIVISNVNNKKLSLEDTRYVPLEYYENLTETRKPHKGDVLYTLVGSYGIPVIVDTDQSFCFQRHMALLKPFAVDTRYLWYVLQTNKMYQEATKIATGTAQLTVPIKGLRKMTIPFCDMDEQHEVVRILDHYYQEENQVCDLEQDVDKRIDNMKKSILSKAFRGELHL